MKRKTTKYPVTASRRNDEYMDYLHDLRNLAIGLNYESALGGSAKITGTVDDNGYKRGCVTVSGTELDGTAAIRLGDALKDIGEALKEFNASYNIEDF